MGEKEVKTRGKSCVKGERREKKRRISERGETGRGEYRDREEREEKAQ